MTKVSFTNMKLKMNTTTKLVETDNPNVTFDVLQYLPINQKYDLIEITLQKSLVNGIYNPLKIEMYFHLYLVYLYTNINFTDAQKKDEEKLYDILESNNIIDYVVDNIPEEEYNTLYNLLFEIRENYAQYNSSFSGILKTLIQELPEQAQKAQDIITKFNPEQFQNVVDFAKAANGGRDITSK